MAFLTIRRWSATAFAAILLGGWGTDAYAQATKADVHAPGGVHFSVSCSGAAQAEFDRGVALLHHMTYPQARESFHRVATIEPACAMAHWGIAMTLFQPLWPTRPGPAELQRGREAVQAARAAGPQTERERRLIAAAGAFFDAPEADYWVRIAAWEAAMQVAHTAFPDDVEVTALTALAHLATTPAGGA